MHECVDSRDRMPPPSSASEELVLRDEVVGVGQLVPLLGGRQRPYVNLDNAASTPPFRSVIDTIERFLPYYASVHRGTGYKSRLSTATYEQARRLVGEFVGADPERDVVVFTRNTTEAINVLARSVSIADDAIVLTTMLEHHSNDLPWRARARVVHVRALPDGTLDEDDLDHQLASHAGRVALLAVSGASNVTGVVQPVHRLAEKVHAVGGRILVDAAQLAAHRPIDIGSHDDSGHLDFVAFSAHKMYAPFGAGALVGCRDGFGPTPATPGGGTVRAVALDEILWADLPDREEAGTPNLIGAVALAAATQMLASIGLERIAAHEERLTRRLTARLATVPGLTIHGPVGTVDPGALVSKLGVVPFTIDGLDHGLVAAALGYEHGIGVRSGCFCAHPYIAHLLGLDRVGVAGWIDRVRGGDKRGAPGMVRISLGCYSDEGDVERVVDALGRVALGDIRGTYHEDHEGSFAPSGFHEPMQFTFGDDDGPPTGRWPEPLAMVTT